MRRRALPSIVLILVLLSSQQIWASAFSPPPKVTLQNTATYSGGLYTWTIFLVADESILKSIEQVEYTLHPSFPNPTVYVKERGTRCPFSFTSTSWSEFEVKVRIYFDDKSTMDLRHWLRLLGNQDQTSCAPPRTGRAKVRRRR
jgi:hypothetical protein